jgi:hypothetical protein
MLRRGKNLAQQAWAVIAGFQPPDSQPLVAIDKPCGDFAKLGAYLLRLLELGVDDRAYRNRDPAPVFDEDTIAKNSLHPKLAYNVICCKLVVFRKDREGFNPDVALGKRLAIVGKP